MNNKNFSWQDLTSSIELSQETVFGEWFAFEQKFGEKGEPGFTEQTIPVKSPGIFGHNYQVDVRFTLFRAEDGSLLCVHGCYIDQMDQNTQKPFIFHVHPDHQRQGVGTAVANYVIQRYEMENNKNFNYEKSWRNIQYTDPSANFANKYVNNIFIQNQNT